MVILTLCDFCPWHYLQNSHHVYWIEYHASPQIHVHLEPENVTLFGNGILEMGSQQDEVILDWGDH